MTIVSWKKQAILAGVLAVLGTFVYWNEYSRKPKIEEKEELGKKIFPIKDVQISTITLDKSGNLFSFKCLELEKSRCKPSDTSQWEMFQPVKMKADNANIANLLTALEGLTPSSTIDLSGESTERKSSLLKDYELSEENRKNDSHGKIEIQTYNGPKYTFYLGVTHPIGNDLFSLRSIDGNPQEGSVYLVPNHIKTNLEKNLSHWRDKKIFSLDTNKVTQFELKNEKDSVSAKKITYEWTLKSPKKNGTFSGDTENIESLLTSINYMQATHFIGQSKKDPLIKKTLLGAKKIISMQITENSKISFEIFEKKEKSKIDRLYLLASNIDTLIEIDPSSKERFNKSISDLRLTRFISSLERFTVKKIELLGANFGDQSVTLEEKDGKWSSKQASVDTEVVQDMLEKISGNKIDDFLTESNTNPPSKDALSLKLYMNQKDSPLREFKFWIAKNGKLLAKDMHSPKKDIYLVNASVKDALAWKKEDLVKKTSNTKAVDESHSK